MISTDLKGWLQHLETLHPRAIELGLDRVVHVRDAMGLDRPRAPIVVVGGTNGKGSCVAYLAALAEARGLNVGVYTSPHLLAYNERVVVAGKPAADATLIEAFGRVEAVRGDVALTYFEFGTLAAMSVFEHAQCDMVVLEVGMGGRLDATNAFDPVAALVVSVGTDHAEWLGADREAIGFEKAGIFRAGRPAVCADPDPPRSLVDHAAAIGAESVRVGVEYRYQVHAGGTWDYVGRTRTLSGLAAPGLAGSFQVGNAAATLAVAESVPGLEPRSIESVSRALSGTRVRARLERVAEAPEVIIDVAHNPEAARVIADELRRGRKRRTHAVCAMLADKRIEETLAALDAVVDAWHVAGLEGPRGLPGDAFAERARAAGLRGTVVAHTDVGAALDAAVDAATADDRILVFGSFLTAAAALRRFQYDW